MARKPLQDARKYCKHCGKILQRKRFPTGLEDRTRFAARLFCNRRCMGGWMEGKIRNLTPSSSRNQARKQMKNACEICGRLRSTSMLYVHHLDENPLNNAGKNLQTLCGTCHRRSHSPNFMGTPTLRRPCLYCARPVMRSGLCWTHRTRRQRYGHPLHTKIRNGSTWVLIMEHGENPLNP